METTENSEKLKNVLLQFVEQNVDINNDEQSYEFASSLLAFLVMFWVGFTSDAKSNDDTLIGMFQEHLTECRKIMNTHQ